MVSGDAELGNSGGPQSPGWASMPGKEAPYGNSEKAWEGRYGDARPFLSS